MASNRAGIEPGYDTAGYWMGFEEAVASWLPFCVVATYLMLTGIKDTGLESIDVGLGLGPV